jgi:hypothetical protein
MAATNPTAKTILLNLIFTCLFEGKLFWIAEDFLISRTTIPVYFSTLFFRLFGKLPRRRFTDWRLGPGGKG